MKCTACGADMEGSTVCKICGEKAENPPQKLEVEYKDFKISEFLEIRPKRLDPLKETVKLSYDDFGKKDVSFIPGIKKPFSAFILILLILAFAAGVFYLLHYLFIW